MEGLGMALSQIPKKTPTMETARLPPYSWKKLHDVSNAITMEAAIHMNDVPQLDKLTRKKKVWKEIKHFWEITKLPEYNKGIIENALWIYGESGVTLTQFVVSIMSEFQFERSLKMEVHLKDLYLYLDGGHEDRADWREVQAMLLLLRLYKLVKPRTVDLLLNIFDIFSLHTDRKDIRTATPLSSSTSPSTSRRLDRSSSSSSSTANDSNSNPTICAYNNYSYVTDKIELRRIFRLPAMS
eukprot:gene12614-26556_t